MLLIFTEFRLTEKGNEQKLHYVISAVAVKANKFKQMFSLFFECHILELELDKHILNQMTCVRPNGYHTHLPALSYAILNITKRCI